MILAQVRRRLFAGVDGLLFFGVRFIRAATSQSARDCTGLDNSDLGWNYTYLGYAGTLRRLAWMEMERSI
jgi:hypothetical protein